MPSAQTGILAFKSVCLYDLFNNLKLSCLLSNHSIAAFDREMKLSSSSSSVAIVPDTPLRSLGHS